MPDQAIQHTFGEPLTLPMTILNYALPLIAFLLTAVGLGVDFGYVALALGSSIAGSLLFGYVRRQKRFWWQIYQGVMSTIGGLILGSFVIWKQGYVDAEPRAMAFCLSSAVSLILLRSVVRHFQANADDLMDRVLLRKEFPATTANRTKGKRTARRTRARQRNDENHVTVEETEAGPPRVTIPPGTEPETVKVVTLEPAIVVETKEKPE